MLKTPPSARRIHPQSTDPTGHRPCDGRWGRCGRWYFQWHWVDSVVSVERHSKRVLNLRMILDNGLLNVLTVYAPHSGKPEEEKEFLEWSVPFGEFNALNMSPITTNGDHDCAFVPAFYIHVTSSRRSYRPFRWMPKATPSRWNGNKWHRSLSGRQLKNLSSLSLTAAIMSSSAVTKFYTVYFCANNNVEHH